MGLVVQLSERRRSDRPVSAPPPGGAEIHLFLGVRYERHAEVQMHPSTPERRGGGGRKARKRA